MTPTPEQLERAVRMLFDRAQEQTWIGTDGAPAFFWVVMGVITAVLTVAGTAASVVDIISRSAAAPSTQDDSPANFSGPRSQFGDAVPFVFGTVQIRSPICIWARTEVTHDTPFGWLAEGERLQYRSSMDLLLCERVLKDGAEYGTIRLRKIWYGDTLLWDGTHTAFASAPVTTSGSLLDHDPNRGVIDDVLTRPGGGYVDSEGQDRLGTGWWWGGLVSDIRKVSYESSSPSFVPDAWHGNVLGHVEKVSNSGVWARYLGLERIRFYAGSGSEAQDPIGFYQYGNDWNTDFDNLYPNFHKFSRLVFDEFYWGPEPLIEDISAEVTVSCPAPEIGDLSGLMSNGLDVNPVSVLYTLLTSPEFCGGPKLPGVDAASFSEARQIAATEGLGMSFRLQSPTKARELVDEILKHLEGMLFLDPETGLIGLRLPRLVQTELPRFTEAHVISLDDVSKTTWEATYSQARVTFEMRGAAGNDASAKNVAVAKDPGLTENAGLIETIEEHLSTVYDPVAANTIAARLLSAANTPLFKIQLKVNRELAVSGPSVAITDLRPGDMFTLDYAPLGTTNIRLRVVKLDLGELDDNGVTVTTIQDVYQARSIIAPPGQPDRYTRVDVPEEVEIDTYSITTAPYLASKADMPGDARRQLTTRIIPRQDDGDPGTTPRAVNYDRFMVLAKAPYEGAALFQWSLSNAAGQVVAAKTIPYTWCAMLAEDIESDLYEPLGAYITLSLSGLSAEMEAYLASLDSPANTPAGKTGRGVLMIGEELFLVGGGAYTPGEDPGTGSISFVQRRALDSEQSAGHTAGAPVWFLGFDNKQWILDRLGPLLESNLFVGRSGSAWTTYLDGLDGEGYGTEVSYAAGYGEPTWTGVLRNVDPMRTNIATSVQSVLQDRANNLLPPLYDNIQQSDPSLGTAGPEPVITVGPSDDSFQIDFRPGDSTSIFNPRESDGKYVLPAIERYTRADDGIDRAEYVSPIDMAEGPERWARIEIWYSFDSPNDGELRRTYASGSSATATFDCTGMASSDLLIYVRQAFGGERTEASDDPNIPIRLSRARARRLTFTRTS